MKIQLPGNIVLGAIGRSSLEKLQRLQALTGMLTCPEETPADCLLEDAIPDGAVPILPKTGIFRLQSGEFCIRCIPNEPAHVSGEWAMMFRFGTIQKILAGKAVFLMHGSLLEAIPEKTKNILVFGFSGAGKSTTSARFRAAGGICRADDIMLCTLENKTLTAFPLPTASYYIEHWTPEMRVNCLPGVQVDSMLFLARSTTEQRIVPLESSEWLSTLVHAMTLHYQWVFPGMPPSLKRPVAQSLLDFAFSLQRIFPPLCLEANLAFDLITTLKDM